MEDDMETTMKARSENDRPVQRKDDQTKLPGTTLVDDDQTKLPGTTPVDDDQTKLPGTTSVNG
jgi:hypothetical protein